MKWYWYIVIFVSDFLIGMGVGWLLTRKKNIDAAHNGVPSTPPAESPAVQSIIERAKQRIHDLLYGKSTR
jgi:hypothetical protein